jgi:hypothetical protein
MTDQQVDTPDEPEDDGVGDALENVAQTIARTPTAPAPAKPAAKPRLKPMKQPAKPAVSKDIIKTASEAEAAMTPEEQAARAEKRRLAHERLSNDQCPICGTKSPKHDYNRPAFVLCTNEKCSVMYHTYPMTKPGLK